MAESGGQSRINARLAALAATPASKGAPATINRKDETRTHARAKVYRFARLVLPGSASVNCVVLDLSQGGARVQFDGIGAGLPEYVTLEFEASSISRKARVAWERHQMAGLAFLESSKQVFGTRFSSRASEKAISPTNQQKPGAE